MAQKITIRNGQICFRNIAGKPTKFNAKGGVRDFAVVLDNYEDVQSLIDLGLSVKYFNKKEETDPDVPFLKVKVNFRYNDDGTDLISPHIYVIMRDSDDPSKVIRKTLITPQTAEIVDQADIDYCDLVLALYPWSVNGKTGVAAYLEKMYVNIKIDEFESKYEVWSDPDEDNAEPIPFE